MQFYLLFVIS